MGCEKGCGKAREMVMWAKDKPSREEQKRRWGGGAERTTAQWLQMANRKRKGGRSWGSVNRKGKHKRDCIETLTANSSCEKKQERTKKRASQRRHKTRGRGQCRSSQHKAKRQEQALGQQGTKTQWQQRHQ